MVPLPYEQPWEAQPQEAIPLDWSDPLMAGLVGSFTPVDPGRQLGGAASVVGNISAGVGAPGRSWTGAYQQSYNYVRVDRTPAFAYTDQVTFEALVFVRAFQTISFPYISGVIGQYQSSADGSPQYYGPVLRFNPTATLGDAAKPCFIIIQGGVEKVAASSTAVSTGLRHLLGTYDGANISLYVDGVLAAQTACTGAFDNHASNWISLLSDYSGWTADTHNRCLNGDLFLARIYNNGKTAAEAAALAANPWRLFEPETVMVPVAAGGGGSYTLTVTPGSYAVSGQSVNLRAARKLSVTQGTYALAGQPVAIGVGRKLAVTQGSYALSGQPVVLRAARRLSVTQGNYALNGQNVTLTKASASSLGVTPGAYSLSGQSVTLLASRKLTATQGAYSLSGQNVTLTKSAAGGLNVTAGSYSLNGQSVGLNTARRLSVAQGAYALSGQQVGLYAAAAPLIVTRGLYVLTGQDVQLHRALRLSVTSGVYAMTGRSVTLLYSAAVSNERDMSAAPRVPRAAGPSRPAQLSSARRPTPSNGTRL